MKYLWWIVAALFGVAAVSVFIAFQNPEFVLGLSAAALTALFQALRPHLKTLFKRMPPEKEKAWNVFNRSNPTPREQRAWLKKWDRDHPNE